MAESSRLRSLLQSAGYLAAIGLIVLTGLVHAYWTSKWSSDTARLKVVLQRLAKLPSQVGPWEGASQEIPAEQLKEGHISGYRAWTFRNREDGRYLTVFIVCGRPGPISLHTPDWCYAGAGYQMQGEIESCEVSSSAISGVATFQSALFRKPKELVPSSLRILWSWNAGDGWETPANPRLSFARRDALCKLYVISQVGNEGGAGVDSLAAQREFLDLLLPVLDSGLFVARNAHLAAETVGSGQ